MLSKNALYRFLTGGPGADIVEGLMQRATREGGNLRMAAVNWGEVYYAVVRRSGYRAADDADRQLEEVPVLIVDSDRGQAEAAGRIKAGYGLPYADFFAAAPAGKPEYCLPRMLRILRKYLG